MAAGLNNANADALAVTLATALGISDQPSKDLLQATWRAVYAALKTDIQITIAINAIATAGGPASQAGPTPAAVNISPN